MNSTPQPKANVPRQWIELRHPETRKMIGKYCPQTHQVETVDRGKRGVIDLPVDKACK